ncbi:CtsR family transcriptional regulator [Weissella cibaria]|uniref:CtsR family transcriptional regulator n=1 Tax=Weissella cibaria TaxID=137591 RepID=UPI00118F9C16|nr:CtsR family transcriptional regulator [Weissella cibaria]MCS8561483.1 CtsR family transcriptional regulator [Weissella cibaria]MCS8565042.1 CtsR family transcriptional regulator [Weissella cibaria]MCS8575541.1 CtsR family transcriptional regulator [Weissella cibaria]MCS9987139.1 CtsR family transcriptional regulator [Weissella cibaria]MCS9999343.1 CtsR family transcriptional regulator [Weissella cibaria]
MADQNMSDAIETYLKQILRQSEKIEIRRSELAQRFDVVPSQINYVIKTRFTIQNGYLVESKRGGGGYIRIVQIPLRTDPRFIEELIQSLSEVVSVREATDIIESLYRDELLTEREGKIVLTMLSKEALAVGDARMAGQLRGQLLRQLLNRLRFESERK